MCIKYHVNTDHLSLMVHGVFQLCTNRIDHIYPCNILCLTLFLPEKVRVYFEMVLEADGSLSTSDRSLYLMYCGLLNKINGAGQSIGKDGKFQLFVCVGIRYRTVCSFHDCCLSKQLWSFWMYIYTLNVFRYFRGIG